MNLTIAGIRGGFMKILIVDDDFICRNLLLEIAKPYGKCEIAVSGNEAIQAVETALHRKEPYDVIFLDIVLPEMDGQMVLRNIREAERKYGIRGLDSEKVIMTTMLEDYENIKRAFSEQCEGYLIKPITREKVIKQFQDLDLLSR